MSVEGSRCEAAFFLFMKILNTTRKIMDFSKKTLDVCLLSLDFYYIC
mgnify:CR=1 FL=1|jgi:hypothetical protein